MNLGSCLWEDAFIFIHMSAVVHLLIFTWTHNTRKSICLDKYTHTYTHTHLHNHTHTRIYIYIYIYICVCVCIVIHRQTCFVLSELFIVARQSRFPKLGSKPGWLKRQSKILLLSHKETSTREGNLNAYVSHLFLFTYIRLTATESSIHMKNLALRLWQPFTSLARGRGVYIYIYI